MKPSEVFCSKFKNKNGFYDIVAPIRQQWSLVGIKEHLKPEESRVLTVETAESLKSWENIIIAVFEKFGRNLVESYRCKGRQKFGRRTEKAGRKPVDNNLIVICKSGQCFIIMKCCPLFLCPNEN